MLDVVFRRARHAGKPWFSSLSSTSHSSSGDSLGYSLSSSSRSDSGSPSSATITDNFDTHYHRYPGARRSSVISPRMRIAAGIVIVLAVTFLIFILFLVIVVFRFLIHHIFCYFHSCFTLAGMVIMNCTRHF